MAAPSARRASPTGEGRRREREGQEFVELDGDEEELLSPSEHMARISERIVSGILNCLYHDWNQKG